MQDNHDPLAVPADAWENQQFERELPSIGEHQAVCSQIHNLGYQEYNGQVSSNPKAAFIFELDEKLKEGKLAGTPMFMVVEFQIYMGEGSKLRTFLENWRNKAFKPEEAQGFTLRSALGKGCTLLVTHDRKKDGTPKAKIAGIAPAKGATPAITLKEIPKWIVEKQEKQVKPKQRAMASAGGPPQAEEDDLPF